MHRQIKTNRLLFLFLLGVVSTFGVVSASAALDTINWMPVETAGPTACRQVPPAPNMSQPSMSP